MEQEFNNIETSSPVPQRGSLLACKAFRCEVGLFQERQALDLIRLSPPDGSSLFS